MSQFQFNAAQVPPSVPFEPVPSDWYLMKVVESEQKPTNDQRGAYLTVTCELLAGPYKGRKVFGRHNTKNDNPQAVEIGFRDISALCHAVQVLAISDTSQLHERPFEGKVHLKPAEGNYEASNELRGYRAVGSGKTVAGNGAGGAGVASAGAGGSAAPSFAPPAPGGYPAAPSFAPPGANAPAAPSFAPPQAAAPPSFAPPVAPPPAFSVAPPAAPPPPVAFPPAGWTAHPSAPGYFYMGQEVLSEAQLRARVAPPAASVAPAVPGFAPPQGGAPAPSWAQR